MSILLPCSCVLRRRLYCKLVEPIFVYNDGFSKTLCTSLKIRRVLILNFFNKVSVLNGVWWVYYLGVHLYRDPLTIVPVDTFFSKYSTDPYYGLSFKSKLEFSFKLSFISIRKSLFFVDYRILTRIAFFDDSSHNLFFLGNLVYVSDVFNTFLFFSFLAKDFKFFTLYSFIHFPVYSLFGSLFELGFFKGDAAFIYREVTYYKEGGN